LVEAVTESISNRPLHPWRERRLRHPWRA
jgi:hypothetical protein